MVLWHVQAIKEFESRCSCDRYYRVRALPSISYILPKNPSIKLLLPSRLPLSKSAQWPPLQLVSFLIIRQMRHLNLSNRVLKSHYYGMPITGYTQFELGLLISNNGTSEITDILSPFSSLAWVYTYAKPPSESYWCDGGVVGSYWVSHWILQPVAGTANLSLVLRYSLRLFNTSDWYANFGILIPDL